MTKTDQQTRCKQHMKLPHPAKSLALLASISVAIAAPHGATPRPSGQGTVPRIAGIMTIGSIHYASFSRPESPWLHEGEPIDKYIIQSIGSSSVSLLDATNNQELRLALENEHTNDTNATPHSEHWIDSSDNPMLTAPTILPNDVRRNWRSYSAEEKQKIAADYESYGWRLIFTDTIWGGISFVWDNPQQTEHTRAVQAERDAFSAQLTGNQLKLWQRIQGPFPVEPGTTNVDQRARVAIEQRAEDIENLTATLDPRQQATLERLTSFVTSPSQK